MGDLIEKIDDIYNSKIKIEFEWKFYNQYFIKVKIKDEIIGSFYASYDYKSTLDCNMNDFINKVDKMIINYYKYRGEEK